MKKIVAVFFLLFSLLGCKDANDTSGDPTPPELLSRNKWGLVRYTTPEGVVVPNNKLKGTALLLNDFYFDYGKDYFVSAYEKKTNLLRNRGEWKLSDDATKLSVKLLGENLLHFKVIKLEKGKMTLQSSTDGFLTGVGEAINLEFQVYL
jgi:hypothetical protein